jgi:hypothetical protein
LASQAVGVAANLLEHIPRKEVVRHTKETLAIFEEVALRALQHWEDIVIEVEILLVEARDAMQVGFDRVAVECWQIFGGYNILVEDDINLFAIYPRRDLALLRYHEMYLAHKGHILGYTTKEVWQGAPVTKTFLQYGLVGVLFVVATPLRIQSIYVCDNYIHFYLFLCGQHRFYYLQRYAFKFVLQIFSDILV